MDKEHERIVQRLVNNLIRDGCPSGQIHISARQNRGLESWTKRKGIVFDRKQEFDILHPEDYSMEHKQGK